MEASLRVSGISKRELLSASPSASKLQLISKPRRIVRPQRRMSSPKGGSSIRRNQRKPGIMLSPLLLRQHPQSETAAQNQANLQAAAKSAQQRQQVQEQDRLAAEQIARDAQTSTSITRPAPILSNTSVGSGSIQGSCTDMTGSVQGSVKIGTDGWVIGYLTNNSNQTLFVSYTFKQNGVPSTAMANAGGTTIQAGQTVGGEGQGLYSTGADKNPPEIYWYAVLKSEHDQYGCVHKW